MDTRYFAFRQDDDGPITDLWRIVRDETGLYGEKLVEGRWVECRQVLECLFDDVAETIDIGTAERLAALFGGSV